MTPLRLGLIAAAGLGLGLGSATLAVAAAPFPAAKADEWTWVDVKGTRCIGGQETGVHIKYSPNPESKAVGLYLNGGGACFNAGTCLATSTDPKPGAPGKGGIFSTTDRRNPYINVTWISVPYCTGDVHLGNWSKVFDLENRHFMGKGNLQLIMERLVATYADVDTFVVTGESAGGFGAVASYDFLRGFYPGPNVRGVMVDDSGPVLDDGTIAPCLKNIWSNTWGLAHTLPAGCRCSQPKQALVSIWNYTKAAWPQDSLALISSLQDSTISVFFSFGNDDCIFGPIPGLYDKLAGGLRRLSAQNTAVYMIAGSEHTHTGDKSEFYTRKVGDVYLYEWVAQLVGPGPDPHSVDPKKKAAPAPAAPERATGLTFAEWERVHAKLYPTAQLRAAAEANFAANLRYYAARNAQEPRAVFGPDEYSGESQAAFFLARAGGFSDGFLTGLQTSDWALHDIVAEAAVAVDWRDPRKNPKKVNAVTSVKNQGAFGTCWSFGATGCLEGMEVIQQGKPLRALSEQELIDCCAPCQGSGPQTSWTFFINHTKGLDATEDSYPYLGKNFSCALKSQGGSGTTVNGSAVEEGDARIAAFVAVSDAGTKAEPAANQDHILAQLANLGPGNIGVDAHCLFGYKKGIISNCTGTSVDHATLLVGAGEEAEDVSGAAVPYWIVKNSWGPGYGEEGFYRMERNTGQCDFHGAAFPLANKLQ